MPAHRMLAPIRMNRSRRTATVALASAGVAALALGVIPAAAESPGTATASGTGSVSWDVKAADIPGQRQPAEPGYTAPELEPQPDGAGNQGSEQGRDRDGAGDDGQAGDQTRDGVAKRSGGKDTARPQDQADGQADSQAGSRAEEAERPEPSEPPAEPAEPAEPEPAAEQPAAQTNAVTYTNDLDGWIRESLDIMAQNGIPGTYDGLYRNIIRESSGDPNAINLWDINAINGTPSIGLLQVIQPTFDAYHVAGTPYDIYHPVSNIVAAANYAADRYGSIDNVFGAY